MNFITSIVPVLCVSFVLAAINVRRAGWLDRVIQFHKQNFIDDMKKLAPVEIKASIQQAPVGYVDSSSWDLDSVLHLLTLIRESETAKPVRLALRRMLRPTRRIYRIDKQKSYKMFPSLMKFDKLNDFYYDMDTDADYSDEDPESTGIPDEDAVIFVSNPVEAKLPSAQISVKLLRSILENRAKAARIMPSTTRSTFPWKVMNTTKADATTAGDDAGAATGADGDGGGDKVNGTQGGGAAPTTAAPAAP